MSHSSQRPPSRSRSIILLGTSLLLIALSFGFIPAALAQEPTVTPSPQTPEQTPEPVEPVPSEPVPSGPELVEPDPIEPEPDPRDPEVGTEDSPETEEAEAPPVPRPQSPCEVRQPGDEQRLDQFRRRIFETVCEAAAGFDGFFGSRRFDEEARRTHGRANARVIWDEHDGFELDGDLRVNVDFPNLDHRVNAFLGRQERDEFLTGDEGDLNFLPNFFEREGGQEWLVGLGYRPVSSDRSSLDFDVGVDVDSNIDPFLRTRYRRYWLVGNDNLLRARQTVYWSDKKGVGSGTRLDYERPLGSRTLTRWTTNLVFDDETEGADWNSGITLYRGFSPDHAIAWYVGINGETGKEVP
ncbi:MAG: hypothetical protein LC732_10530, partial [Acidobacteria bacterium]|nr:hypothetical protein [Acidobacteriota bacterium]